MKRLWLVGLLLCGVVWADEPLPQAKTYTRDRMEILGATVTDGGQSAEFYFTYGTQDAQGKFLPDRNIEPKTLTMLDLVTWVEKHRHDALLAAGTTDPDAQQQAERQARQEVQTFLRSLAPDFQSIKGKLVQYLRQETLMPEITAKYQP